MTLSPWIQMWVKPRQTIRQIVSVNPSAKIYWLSLVYGFPMVLYLFQGASLAQNTPLPIIFLFALIGGLILGFIGISIGSALIYWTGKWVGGKGSYKQVRAAIAWSNVTNTVNCVLWLLMAFVFGKGLFLADFAYTPFVGTERLIVNFIFIAQFIISIWSLVIFFKALGEVQGFSAWKAILNALLPVFLIFVACWAIGFLMNLLGCGTVK